MKLLNTGETMNDLDKELLGDIFGFTTILFAGIIALSVLITLGMFVVRYFIYLYRWLGL